MKKIKKFFSGIGTGPHDVAWTDDIDGAVQAGSRLIYCVLGASPEGILVKRRTPGERILLEHVLVKYPELFIIADLSEKDLVPDFCRTVKKADAQERILVSSSSSGAIRQTRKLLPVTACAFSTMGLLGFYWLFRSGILPFVKNFKADALIIPQNIGPSNFTGRVLIREAVQRKISVFFWNVEEESVKNDLVSAGVTGFISGQNSSCPGPEEADPA